MHSLKSPGFPRADDKFWFQRRPLTTSEANQIIKEIAAEPNITGYSCAEWTGGKDVFLLYDWSSNCIAAAILVHHLFGLWSEIAVVFVSPAYRGQQLGRRLLQLAMDTLRFSGRRYVIFYSTSSMEGMLRSIGFTLYRELDDFAKQRTDWGIYFRLLYKPQWLLNVYRIRELQRKQRIYEKSFCFSVGVLITQP
ncbi:GNAT family N-acetyltransferase [Hydrogenophaga soli]